MFRRITNLFRGFLGLFVSGIEKKAPEALLEVEKENLREQIARYNSGLAQHAGLCERLISQVKKLEVQEREIRAKTTAHLRAGNRDAAGQYAVQLQTVTNELQEDRRQLEQAEVTYRELIKARDVSVRAAQAKIDSLRYSLDDLKVKKATAELAQMATGMVSQIGSAGDTLDRLTKMVDEERQYAAGRARVARDSIDNTQVQLKDGEQKAMADQALADFAAREGISLDAPAHPSTPASEPPAKSMGPIAE